MHDDDLRNFFDEDAYKELLDVYAEEDSRKESERARREQRSQRASVEPPRKTAPAQRTPNRQSTPSAREHTKPAPAPRKPQIAASPKHEVPQPVHKTEGFKLEIKGLDEEFSTPPAAKRTPKAQPTYYVAKAKGEAPTGQKHSGKPQKGGAFSNFSEIIKKRNKIDDPAAGNFMVTDATVPTEGGAAAKKGPVKLDWNTIKAFFLKNKTAWIVVLICVVSAILLSIYTISCINDVLAINRDSETVVAVNIPADADTKTVLKILQDNDLIEHRHFCRVVAKIMKFKDDNYLTGIYYVTASMGVEKMLSTFKVAPTTGETVTLTFPEGYTVDQIVEKLDKYEVCDSAVMYQTMKEVDFSGEYSFIKEEDNKDERYHLLEGYLYPDTYEFYIGENPSSVIRKFLNNFQKKWTEEYAKQAEKLNMSVDDIITLASIIQKEAYGADQSPLVSSVLHNRLDNSSLYPSLQCDSTTEYINETIAKNVTDAAQLANYTNLYSSYKCEGLPVGAICNPGDDAIKAALYPEDTKYYFFAHDVNKKLYLARNDSERVSNNIAILNANSAAEKKGSN